MKQCNRCLFTEDIATIHEDGECNYCKLQDQLKANANPYDWPPILKKIKKKGFKNQYDCIVGVSGGADSSILLYMVVKWWDLRPLVVHFDNRWNTPMADNNIKVICDYLNVNSVTYKLDKEEFDNLNKSFLAAGTPDCDIPNDIAMTKISYQLADQYKIKYIMAGHDFRTEGSTPAKWTYMDSRYIQDVYRKYTGKELKNYPLFSITDQIKYGLKGIVHVRPFHYIEVNQRQRNSILDILKAQGWQDYGAKHCENTYTEWIGSYVLPKKFNIDKRIVYLSAQIRNNDLDKQEAKYWLQVTSEFDLTRIPVEYKEIVEKAPIQERTNFDRYNFRKYKFIFWLLMRLKVVPYTFYVKYCK